jgi:uncharacterized protein (DUF2126 family)
MATARKTPIRKTAPARTPAAKAPAAKAPVAKAAKRVKAPKAPKADKPAKERKALVRDSFTMPHHDFALIAALKARAMEAKRAAKKSELLRAGLNVLAGLSAAGLVLALDKLTPLKPGRPKKDR